MLPIVRDFMDKVVVTVGPKMPIVDCVQMLLAKGVTGAPVVSDEGRVIGIVTARDCLQILAEGQNAERPAGSVSDFMSSKVVSVKSSMNIYFAAGLFLGNNFRRFPVIDDGVLVGGITRFDILRAIAKHYS